MLSLSSGIVFSGFRSIHTCTVSLQKSDNYTSSSDLFMSLVIRLISLYTGSQKISNEILMHVLFYWSVSSQNETHCKLSNWVSRSPIFSHFYHSIHSLLQLFPHSIILLFIYHCLPDSSILALSIRSLAYSFYHSFILIHIR